MRIPILPTLVLSASLAACRATTGDVVVTDARRADVTRQVDATVDSLFADMNAGDVDRIYDHYRRSDDFLYVTVNETMRSWKTFSSVSRSFYAQHPGVKFEYRIVQTQVPAPNVAVVTIAGSATMSPHLTWTQVWVREGGRWVCTLENEAWPGASPPPEAHPSMEPADTSSGR